MNASDIEDLYRSRKTLLKILELRGYDTKPFENFSPEEIAVAVPTPESLPALSFNLKKIDPSDSRICYIRYGKFSRQKLANTFENAPVKSVGETIVLTMDPVLDVHHQLALRLCLQQPEPILVSFFWTSHIVNNPMDHILVPKHELLSEKDKRIIMDKYNIIANSKFPLIRFHIDPIIRILGGVPGDLVKITRPSASAGVYETYRLVSP
jgi:DNA-directed RNA polymerase I, II, and III subunit RPABC1